jgi:enamine deaminase RidA (YjgF/YER057c/UK114 family)
VGKLGQNMTTDEGQQAARAVAIDLMGTLAVAAGGLDKVVRIVKVMSLVNSTPSSPNSTSSPMAAPNCSARSSVKRGVHARSAFGVAQIPLGACVEIELIAEVA